MVGSKQSQPVFLSTEEAESHCRAGASVWKYASTDSGLDPDVVLVGIGAEITFEVIEAAAWLRKNVPSARIRVVNVTDLLVLQHQGGHPHSLSATDFDALFTADRPIHFNYHGYQNELKGLLFGRPHLDRVSIEAYSEEGSTTTPLHMMIVNRYVIRLLGIPVLIVSVSQHVLKRTVRKSMHLIPPYPSTKANPQLVSELADGMLLRRRLKALQ